MTEEKSTPTMELVDAPPGDQLVDLTFIQDKKRKKLDKIGVSVLKKSQFYNNGDLLREHIATYKNKAILIKQESITNLVRENKEPIDVQLSIIELADLQKLKKVNGNLIRKIQPKTLYSLEKIAAITDATIAIDKS